MFQFGLIKSSTRRSACRSNKHSADHVLLGQRSHKVGLPDGGGFPFNFVVIVAVQLQLAHVGNLESV